MISLSPLVRQTLKAEGFDPHSSEGTRQMHGFQRAWKYARTKSEAGTAYPSVLDIMKIGTLLEPVRNINRLRRIHLPDPISPNSARVGLIEPTIVPIALAQFVEVRPTLETIDLWAGVLRRISPLTAGNGRLELILRAWWTSAWNGYEITR